MCYADNVQSAKHVVLTSLNAEMQYGFYYIIEIGLMFMLGGRRTIYVSEMGYVSLYCVCENS